MKNFKRVGQEACRQPVSVVDTSKFTSNVSSLSLSRTDLSFRLRSHAHIQSC